LDKPLQLFVHCLSSRGTLPHENLTADKEEYWHWHTCSNLNLGLVYGKIHILIFIYLWWLQILISSLHLFVSLKKKLLIFVIQKIFYFKDKSFGAFFLYAFRMVLHIIKIYFLWL